MTKQLTTTTVMTIFGLMVLSTSYIASFQNWVVLNAASISHPQSHGAYPVVHSQGIRAIVSDNKELTSVAAPQIVLTNSIDLTPVKDLTPSKKQVAGLAELPMDSTIKISMPQNALIETVTQSDNQDPLINPNFARPETTHLIKSPPLVVELENELLIEFSADYTQQEMQKALSRLLVQPHYLDAEDLISTQAINTRVKPYLYGKVLNQFQNPIRYPAQAFRYAQYLLTHNLAQVQDDQGQYSVITVPLTERRIPSPIKDYQAWVNEYAQKYKVSAELIFAIMHVESAFNPTAVSKSNALGLMQVKANTAGRDVYQHIDQRAGQPSQSDLFDPQENIRVGTAYMGLLNNLYLKNIRNDQNKELVAISSYNGGLSTVLKLFGNTPENAIKRINQLHPRQVYRILRYTHHSVETKNYIEKVTQAKNRYKELLNFAA